MAKTLQQPLVAVDLRGVVSAAIENVRAVRNMRAIEIETEFQKQVADGLSYDAQIDFLQEQLDKESASSFKSDDIIADIKSRIADTKRLKRFNTYRTKYETILQELVSGKASAAEQLGQLRSLLDATSDDELRLEIQKDITSLKDEVKNVEDTMIQNKIKKAQYDGTEKVLSSTLSMVKDKRSKALLNGLDDEASAYDVWITVLNKQLSEVSISDAMTDIEVISNTRGLRAKDKLDQVNALINIADGSAPVTINNVTYDSAKAYWTNVRDSYLAGTGSGLFNDFFREIDGEYNESISAAVARDGVVTTVVLDRIQNDFKELKSRSEMQPFINRVQDYESLIQAGAIESTANTIIDRVSATGDYVGADRALRSYQNKYGVNVDSYRLVLSSQAEQRAATIVNASDGRISPEEARKQLGVSDILMPDDPGFQTPEAAIDTASNNVPATSERKTITPSRQIDTGSISDYLSSQGEDNSFEARQKLAEQRGISNYTGSAEQNTTLLQKLKTERSGNAVDTQKTQEPVQEPKTNATPQNVYGGNSIVDYLNSIGEDSSYANRQKIAGEQGISNYQGSAEQNTTLLKKMRGF